MSKFRERTAAIVEQGEAERKSFQPKGAPARVYDYWLNKSDSSKASAIRNGRRRENFCHWFWVVVFFAPMLRLGNFIDDHAWVLALPFAALGIGGFVYAVVTAGWLATLAGLGVGVAVVAVLMGMIFGVAALCERYPTAATRVFVILAILVAVGIVGLLVAAFIDSTGTIGAFIVAVLAIVIAVVVWKFQTIASYIEGKAEQGEEKRRERMVAEILSPKEPREPGKVSKFFKGFGEFIVMVAQFIRVKKWKTCPLIEVNTRTEDVL